MATTVAIPAVRRGDLGDRLKAFQATERRFVCQARTAVLVTLAAVARVVAAFATGWSMPLLVGSASLWIAAFALFVLFHGPMLLLTRPTR